MTQDKNKEIQEVRYNLLNLPERNTGTRTRLLQASLQRGCYGFGICNAGCIKVENEFPGNGPGWHIQKKMIPDAIEDH